MYDSTFLGQTFVFSFFRHQYLLGYGVAHTILRCNRAWRRQSSTQTLLLDFQLSMVRGDTECARSAQKSLRVRWQRCHCQCRGRFKKFYLELSLLRSHLSYTDATPIAPQRVKRYLTSHGVRENLFCDPNGQHGQALIRGIPALNEILRWLSEDET